MLGVCVVTVYSIYIHTHTHCAFLYVHMYSFFKALRSQKCARLPKYLTFLPGPRNKSCLKKHIEQLLALFEMSWIGINVLVITSMYGNMNLRWLLLFPLLPTLKATQWARVSVGRVTVYPLKGDRKEYDVRGAGHLLSQLFSF